MKAPVPMAALLAAELPAGGGWQYEPKWDGFRCLARRDGDHVELISKSGKPLGRVRSVEARASALRTQGDLWAMIADLFGEPLIAGLDYHPEFITSAEERELADRLSGTELAPFRFQGWTGKRLTRTFGWRYDFDDSSFSPAEAIPGWLKPLREKAADFAAVKPEDFVHALLVRYDPDAGIGWHRDRPVFETVVGVSLGSPAVLRFRRRRPGGFDRSRLEVEPRSAYLLSGAARLEWEHSIAPGDSLRFSITFRSLPELGRRKAESA